MTRRHDGSFARRLAASALYYTGGLEALERLARPPRQVLQIFGLHRVNDQKDPFLPATPTEVFRRQMAYLARSATVISLSEAVDRLKDGSLPPRAVALTFDDGYRDNATIAWPILRSLGLPATCFPLTGCLETGETPWYERVRMMFSSMSSSSLDLDGAGPGLLRLESLEERVGAFHTIIGWLKSLPNADRLIWVEELERRFGSSERRRGSAGEMLSWEEVKTLARDGMEFGSHTVTHPVMSRLSPEEMRRELTQSKKALEDVLQRPVTLFSYPHGQPGDFNEESRSALAETGFRAAVTCEFGVNTPRSDPLELRRGGPWEEHLPTFATKLVWYRAKGRHSAKQDASHADA